MRKNNKFFRYGLSSYFTSNGKSHPAYGVDENGAIHRMFRKTNKKWRRSNGL